MNFIDLVHPDEKKKILEEQHNAINEGKPFHFIYRIIKKDKSIAWIEEFGDAIHKDGKISSIEKQIAAFLSFGFQLISI